MKYLTEPVFRIIKISLFLTSPEGRCFPHLLCMGMEMLTDNAGNSADASGTFPLSIAVPVGTKVRVIFANGEASGPLQIACDSKFMTFRACWKCRSLLTTTKRHKELSKLIAASPSRRPLAQSLKTFSLGFWSAHCNAKSLTSSPVTGNLNGATVTQQGEPGVIVQQGGSPIVQQLGGASPIVQKVSSPVVQSTAPPAAQVVQTTPTVVQQPKYPVAPPVPVPPPGTLLIC